MNNTLKVERAIKGITQKQLAEAIGVSAQTIHSIEIGKYVPSVLLCMKLARYFEKPNHEFFTLEEDD